MHGVHIQRAEERVVIGLARAARTEGAALEQAQAHFLAQANQANQALCAQNGLARLPLEQGTQRNGQDVLPGEHGGAQVFAQHGFVSGRANGRVVPLGDVGIGNPVHILVRVLGSGRYTAGELLHHKPQIAHFARVRDGEAPFHRLPRLAAFDGRLEGERSRRARGQEQIVQGFERFIDVKRRFADEGFVHIVVQVGGAQARARVHFHGHGHQFEELEGRVRPGNFDGHRLPRRQSREQDVHTGHGTLGRRHAILRRAAAAVRIERLQLVKQPRVETICHSRILLCHFFSGSIVP